MGIWGKTLQHGVAIDRLFVPDHGPGKNLAIGCDQPEARPHLRGEEVSSYQNVHMGIDELRPGGLFLAIVSRW